MTELETVRVTRRFTASPERVFDAWLDPTRIRTWMLAPSKDDEILRIEIDARVGGAFSFLVRRQGQEIDHFGVPAEYAGRTQSGWSTILDAIAASA